MRVIREMLSDIESKTFDIGFVGEKNHTCVMINCVSLFKQYPDAVATMVARPPVGDIYPVVLHRDGVFVVWNVSESDIANAGSGQYQLTFTDGEGDNAEIIKTVYGSFSVKPSMVSNGEAPDPIEDWLEEANEALAEFGKINELSASATTLAAGSEATAEITTVSGHKNIVIGVPKGDKGDDGDPAPAEEVTAAVDAYLAENFSNPSNPPLDRSLSSSSSAAPADLVGNLKSAFRSEHDRLFYRGNQLYDVDHADVHGYYFANSPYNFVSNSGVYGYYIPVTPGEKITFSGATNYSAFTSSILSSVNAIEAFELSVSNLPVTKTVPAGAEYLYVGCLSSGKANMMVNKGESALPREDYIDYTTAHKAEYDTAIALIPGIQSDINGLKPQRKTSIEIYSRKNNMLDFVTYTDGYFRNAQDGSYVANSSYCYTNPIYVKPGDVVQLSTAYHTCFCDADNTFVSGQYNATILIVPSGCFLVTVSIPKTDKSSATVYVKSRDDETGVIYGNNRNMLTNMQYEDQYYYAYNTNTRTYNANYCNTGLIAVDANTPIYLHNINGPHTCFYDKYKNYISGSLNPYFTTPSNCVYMRVSMPIADKTNAVIKRYDREDKIKVGTENDMIPYLNYAYALSQLCDLPIYIYGGEYNIGTLFGGYGFNPVNDVIGIGMPRLYVNKDSFDVNLSCFMLNRANREITIDGFILEVTNGRYCVHDEAGALTSGQFYKHTIRNCRMKQNTAIQQDFTYPRCIGIGLGNNGQIIIENCYLESNVPEEIDAHTGYSGQAQNAHVIVKDCVMPNGTVTLTYAGVGSGFKDTMIVSNCLVNATPHASDNATVEMTEYNNKVVS